MTLRGSVSVEKLQELFGVEFARREVTTATTVAGLLNRIAGHVPRPGERLEYNGLRFEVVEANQRIADGSRQLVTADAASRQELATLQRELRADQADIAQQYQVLAERHTQWVDARDRDAQMGSAILGLALILACLLPLLLAAWALFGRNDPPTVEEIDAVLNQAPPSTDGRKEPTLYVAHRAHQNPSS